jgi:YggT family protein
VYIVTFVSLLFNALTFALIARALISWFPIRPDHPIVRILYDITEPILAPLRRVIPMIGMIDITPLVALLLLQVIERFLIEMLRSAPL